jgi:hydroxylamine reductase (hybrid-cluster protein)
MEQKCQFCCEVLEEGAKKCKVCGEPFYFMGKVLKWIPCASLISIVATIISLCFAYNEAVGKEKATIRAENAQKARLAVTKELNTKEKAADLALREVSRRLPVKTREDIIKGLQLPSKVTLENLENEAKSNPENSDIQRKLYLYRVLKRPGG